MEPTLLPRARAAHSRGLPLLILPSDARLALPDSCLHRRHAQYFWPARVLPSHDELRPPPPQRRFRISRNFRSNSPICRRATTRTSDFIAVFHIPPVLSTSIADPHVTAVCTRTLSRIPAVIHGFHSERCEFLQYCSALLRLRSHGRRTPRDDSCTTVSTTVMKPLDLLSNFPK